MLQTPLEVQPALITTLSGHSNAVAACHFSPDGTRIASFGWDGTVRVWSVAEGRELSQLVGWEGVEQPRCGFSPDGTRILTASASGLGTQGWQVAMGETESEATCLSIWDVESGRRVAVLERHEAATQVALFSPDGRQVVSGSQDGTLRIWDSESNGELQILSGHRGAVTACEFAPDGTRILSGGRDGTLRVWERHSGRELATLVGGHGVVTAVRFVGGADRALSVTADGAALWNLTAGCKLAWLEGHEGPVNGCATSSDGSRIATVGEDRTLRLWEGATGRPLAVLEGHSHRINACTFSPSGDLVASASEDRTVRVWDARTHMEVAVLTGHAYAVFDCAFSPDGLLLVSASWDTTLKLWDIDRARSIPAARHTDRVVSCRYSQNGEQLVSAGRDGTVKVSNRLASGAAHLAVCASGSVAAFCMAPDATRLAVMRDDGAFELWDGGSGAMLAVRGESSDPGPVTSCAASTNGERFAVGYSSGYLQLLDAATGRSVASAPERIPGGVYSCAVGADGVTVVAGGWAGSPWWWHGRTLREIGKGFDGPVQCVLAPDDTTIVAWGEDAWTPELQLCRPDTGPTILSGHRKGIIYCTFDPRGSLLLSLATDGTIRLWEVATGAELATYEDPELVACRAAFCTNGRHFVTVGLDGGVRLWALSRDAPVAVAFLPVPLSCLDIDPRAGLVACGDELGSLYVFELPLPT